MSDRIGRSNPQIVDGPLRERATSTVQMSQTTVVSDNILGSSKCRAVDLQKHVVCAVSLHLKSFIKVEDLLPLRHIISSDT